MAIKSANNKTIRYYNMILFAVTLSSIVFQVVQSVKTGRLIILQFYITYFYHLIRFFHSYLSTTSIRENMGG